MNVKRIVCICIAVLLFALALLPAIVRADDSVLSVGKSYTLFYDSPIEHAYPAYTYEPETKLTDGKFASVASFSDKAFLELYRGTSVSVTIDLEKVCSVSAVELRTLQNKAAGIYCARYVEVRLSDNGTDFGLAGSINDAATVTDGAKKIVTHRVELDKAYSARYVRVTFSCDVYCYADEITVYGSEDVSGASSVAYDPLVEEKGYSNEIDGIGNIVLMYTVGNYTEETLKPYFAYVDTAGKITDTMFDSMLFLPSPASGYNFSKPETWDSYIEAMFGVSTHTNLSALDSLVGSLRNELNLDASYRYPVFLAIPYLEIGSTSFGGVRPSNLANRLSIISSYIDKMIVKFEDSSFSNLELKGMYWFHESIAYSASTYEEELMIEFNKYVHSKGLKSIWIPYYCSPGYERASELGFDSTTLQSGYAFPRSGDSLGLLGQVLPEVVEDSAAQARKYGLGMEFELDLGATDVYNRFYKYLHTGYSTGCMNGHMMMLYQVVDAVYKCFNSPASTDQRKIYDLLYQYNKGTFTSNAPVIESDQVIVSDLGKRKSGTLAIIDEDSMRNDLEIVDMVASEGLAFILEGDGFYLVNTTKTTPGLYSLEFKVSDGYNISEPSVVKVFVADFDSPDLTAEITNEIILFDRLNENGSGITVASGSTINVYSMEDGWSYIIAEINGEEVSGFAKYSDSTGESSEQSIASGDDTNSFAPWIIVSACVIFALAVCVFLIVKKQKNKG